ncbi:MAG: hypothetical protein ACRES8_04555 [Nevskiaceae bacterium]
MTDVVDVVNFNADASCLPAAAWLDMLSGGAGSPLCRWLRLYAERERPVVLGFIGGAVADMAMLNPEAIAVVNDHPKVFEVLLRPFAHDIALLRSSAGFAANVTLGERTLRREFRRVVDSFLPPEFMLSSTQVKQLQDAGVGGLFINAARFKDELQGRIPESPYVLEGVLGSSLRCIPFAGALTDAYLGSIHFYDATPWNDAVAGLAGPAFSWRDGESCFLVPDGIAREAAWLDGESAGVRRRHLSDVRPRLSFAEPDARANAFRTYPPHSFSAWFKENRMLGFLGRLQQLEARLGEMSTDARVLWLQAINSDILSAVEKDSPTIRLADRPGDGGRAFTLWRSERGFEGEDFLARLEGLFERGDIRFVDDAARRPHIRKLKARVDYVRALPAEGA